MEYRTFGKTGLTTSVLGFGCMRLPVIDKDVNRINEDKAMEMIRHAIDRGVNYLDTAYSYHSDDFNRGGSSEPFLAGALKDGYRERVYLATKLPCWMVHSREDMDRFLDEQLERLDSGHIDFYLLHSLNVKTWDKMVQLGIRDFLDRALGSGKIRYAGFSFHDDLSLFKEVTDAYDWSFCQIMYNYFDENFQAGKEGLKYAAGKDIAVVAMEPLRGGALVDGLPPEAGKILREAAPDRTAVDWAFRWLWDQPEVSVVLSGMSAMEQVVENLDLASQVSNADWTHRDSEAVRKVNIIISKLQKVDCTSCGYCMPCPEGVDIPRNFMLCNDHYMLKDRSAKVRYQRLLGEQERASNCIACGICEEKCPQQIHIAEEMEHVSALFGNG